MNLKRYSSYFVVDKRLLFRRIGQSVIPIHPYRRQIDVDVVGAFIAVTILVILLYCGPTSKLKAAPVSPVSAVSFYILVIPLIIFILLKVDKSYLNYFQVLGLVGYALYSHILIIIWGLFFSTVIEPLGLLFYVFVFLAALASLKLFAVFLTRTRNPGVRFLVCSIACISNTLFLLFSYLFYVHPTYTHPSFTVRSE